MPILRYIPKKKNVIDRRSNEGGFYEAECEECGGKFFPKRGNAKYCSQSCLQMAWRKKHKDKKVKSKVVKATKEIKEPKKTESKRFHSKRQVIEYLKIVESAEVKGKIGMLLDTFKKTIKGENTLVGKHVVDKVGQHTYVVYKNQ